MFERYTEAARHVVFCARHEAQKAGSDYIEPEHFLIGLVRQDSALLPSFLPEGADVEALLREVQEGMRFREPKATSVDLPLSHAMKRVLAYGAEESERMHHRHIGTDHHLLGLLRESSSASRVLEKHGVGLEAVRQEILRNSKGSAAVRVPASVGNELRPGQFSSTHGDDGTLVIETNRFYQSHKITLIERLKVSDDGKTLQYSQELRGPKKEHQFTIDFDVS